MRYTKNGGRKLSHEVNESNPIRTIFMSLSSDTLSITFSFVNISMIANELEKSHQNAIFGTEIIRDLTLSFMMMIM